MCCDLLKYRISLTFEDKNEKKLIALISILLILTGISCGLKVDKKDASEIETKEEPQSENASVPPSAKSVLKIDEPEEMTKLQEQTPISNTINTTNFKSEPEGEITWSLVNNYEPIRVFPARNSQSVSMIDSNPNVILDEPTNDPTLVQTPSSNSFSSDPGIIPYFKTNCSFNIELLIFRPSIDQSSFVISSSDNHVGNEFFPNGKRHLNQTGYKPGVRLEGTTELCNGMTLDLRWSYFSNGYSSHVSGPFLYDTIGYPGDGAQSPEDTSYSGTASIRDRFRYNGVDFTVSRYSLNSCFENLFLLVGLHCANIQHQTTFTSSGTFIDAGAPRPVSNLLLTSSNFWGIGPQLGIDYTYRVTPEQWCLGCFTLGFNARGSLLCSDTNANLHYGSLRTAPSAGVNLNNEHLWRVTPAFDTRFEVNYQFCYNCWNLTVALGYEWIWYADCVDSIRGIDVAFAGDSIDLFSNFSLQGPYLKFGAAF